MTLQQKLVHTHPCFVCKPHDGTADVCLCCCTCSYCGWHTYLWYNNVAAKYAFIGECATGLEPRVQNSCDV